MYTVYCKFQFGNTKYNFTIYKFGKMNIFLRNSQVVTHKLSITGSKSETNRLLLLQALYPNISLENTSNSDDSEVMISIIQNFQLPTSNFQLFH